MNETFNITPSPRVLRMLGQIEFKPWQCLAELIDNSVDSFLEGRSQAMILQPEIRVSLPSAPQLKAGSGKIRIRDNGLGMTPRILEDAVKAGYSGNDPVEKLGLFGMGFNISTARLGRRTEVWTITPDSAEWTGMTIDFDDLERTGKFEVPRLSRPRGVDELQTHGTELVIARLDENRVSPLIRGRGRHVTQQKLGRIYSRLMSEINLEIRLDGELIKPRPHCVWDASRQVETPLGPVAAMIPINEELPPRPYCTTCWVWLAEAETMCPACGSSDSVSQRPRVIRGWVGIQRFFDLSHYGIDLIRNGRVIEELDKSLFYWVNTETDEQEKEYPIDTQYWGGRIVGELEIDFVRISHQKDAFDKHDPQWQLVVNVVRDNGPLRPDIAKARGYPVNLSPLARLFAGYRTGNVAGLKRLVPGTATASGGINEEPKRWADLFWRGESEYQTDEKWYEAVCFAEEFKKKQASKGKVEEVAGEPPFATEEEEPQAGPAVVEGPVAEVVTGPRLEDDLALSSTYEIREMNGSPTLKVKACYLVEGQLENDQPVRMLMRGNEAEFEYDPAHEYFEASLDTPAECLIREIAYQLLLRSHENQNSWPITRVEQELRRRYFTETLLDLDALARQATAFLDSLRDFLQDRMPSLAPVDPSMLTDRDRDDIRLKLLVEGQASEERVSEIISTGQFPRYLGLDFFVRAVSTWPDLVLDGQFLSVAYTTVAEGMKQAALEQVLGPIRDVAWLCEQATMPGFNQQQWRQQLARAAAGLHLLDLWRE